MTAEELEVGDVVITPGDAPAFFLVLKGTLTVSMPRRAVSSSVHEPVQTHRAPGTEWSSPSSSFPGNKSDGVGMFVGGGENRVLWTVHAGGVVGLLQIQTGEPSVFSARVSSEDGAVVVRLPRLCYARMAQRKPMIIPSSASRILRSLSPVVMVMDYALQWKHMLPGDVLVHEGKMCDALHVVLTGRLRSTEGP